MLPENCPGLFGDMGYYYDKIRDQWIVYEYVYDYHEQEEYREQTHWDSESEALDKLYLTLRGEADTVEEREKYEKKSQMTKEEFFRRIQREKLKEKLYPMEIRIECNPALEGENVIGNYVENAERTDGMGQVRLYKVHRVYKKSAGKKEGISCRDEKHMWYMLYIWIQFELESREPMKPEPEMSREEFDRRYQEEQLEQQIFPYQNVMQQKERIQIPGEVIGYCYNEKEGVWKIFKSIWYEEHCCGDVIPHYINQGDTEEGILYKLYEELYNIIEEEKEREEWLQSDN